MGSADASRPDSAPGEAATRPAPGAPPPLDRLKKRRDFLRVRKGARVSGEAFAVECARSPSDTGAARVGFTVTKKVGNAVERNRIRRRLRAAVADLRPFMRGGFDYVVVARRPALWLDFARLEASLAHALAGVHDRLDRPRPRKGARRGRTTRDGRDDGSGE